MWTCICQLLSLNTFYLSYRSTRYVYLHVHVLHCYLHHTKSHNMLTMCEHYCVNMHMWIIVFKYILPFISMYNICLSTCTCTTLSVIYYHVWTLLCVWTCICELFKLNIPQDLHGHVQFMCIYMFMYYTIAWIFTYANSMWTCMYMWTCICELFKYFEL